MGARCDRLLAVMRADSDWLLDGGGATRVLGLAGFSHPSTPIKSREAADSSESSH